MWRESRRRASKAEKAFLRGLEVGTQRDRERHKDNWMIDLRRNTMVFIHDFVVYLRKGMT